MFEILWLEERRIQCFFGFLFCCDDFVFVGETRAKEIGSGGFKATFGYMEMKEREEK